MEPYCFLGKLTEEPIERLSRSTDEPHSKELPPERDKRVEMSAHSIRALLLLRVRTTWEFLEVGVKSADAKTAWR